MRKVLPDLALAFLLLGLFIGGRSIVQRHLQQAQTLVNDQVNSIARLKVQQIAAWRKERLGDAELLRVNPAIVTDLLRYLADGAAPRERGDTRIYLEALLQQYGYEGFLLIDAAGKVRYSSLGSGRLTLDEEGQAALAEAWRTRRAVLFHFYFGSEFIIQGHATMDRTRS